jgi:16S rRNA (guanine527-N7)-methyltransferase
MDAQDDFAPLIDGAAALGVALDDAQLDQFRRFRDLLLEANTRVNLTAITDPAAVVTRHFLDSLTCLLAVAPDQRARPLRLLDIGSGAGFPGLPLAIAVPAWRVISLEATGKKARFQKEVVAALGLANVTVLTGRAEEFAHNQDHRGRYDLVTARAVAALPTLLEYCCPFVRVGGRVIAPKKGDLADEVAARVKAASLLGAQLLAPIPITISPLADGRALLVTEQKRPCPQQYPRPAGAPTKHPLGAVGG